MPNWCSNALVIDDKELFAQIVSYANEFGEIENLFGRFRPMPAEFRGIKLGLTEIDGKNYSKWREVDGEAVPVTDEELEELQKKFGARDWLGWAASNWGTKWDVEARVDPVLGDRVIQFESAWGPPTEFVAWLSMEYPDHLLTLAYAEGGNGFYGEASFLAGQDEGHWHREDFWKEDVDWNEIDDSLDATTDRCREHLDEYGLHTGG